MAGKVEGIGLSVEGSRENEIVVVRGVAGAVQAITVGDVIVERGGSSKGAEVMLEQSEQALRFADARV